MDDAEQNWLLAALQSPEIMNLLERARKSMADDMRQQAERPNWGDTRWVGPFPLPGADSNLGAFMQQAPTALLGMGPRTASGAAAAATGVEGKAMRPDGGSVAQHLYEAALGRPPGGGPGSGSPWRSPLFWGLQAGNVYGNYKLWGIDEAIDAVKRENDPSTPEYAAREALKAKHAREAEERAKQLEMLRLEQQFGLRGFWEGPNSIFGKERPDIRTHGVRGDGD